MAAKKCFFKDFRENFAPSPKFSDDLFSFFSLVIENCNKINTQQQWHWRRADKLSAATAVRRSTKVGGGGSKWRTSLATFTLLCWSNLELFASFLKEYVLFSLTWFTRVVYFHAAGPSLAWMAARNIRCFPRQLTTLNSVASFRYSLNVLAFRW